MGDKRFMESARLPRIQHIPSRHQGRIAGCRCRCRCPQGSAEFNILVTAAILDLFQSSGRSPTSLIEFGASSWSLQGIIPWESSQGIVMEYGGNQGHRPVNSWIHIIY